MNLRVAAGILPAVEPWLPARRNGALRVNKVATFPIRWWWHGLFRVTRCPSTAGKITFPVIDTDEKLAVLLPGIRAAAWIAVDTEADSLHAYPEKVCLIQISTVAGDNLIDPLARINLDPMLDALTAHALIMHGADYDLRLLRKHHEFVPGAIFDTMLAARLLGLRQFGLSHLVEHYLGIKLEKTSQKANWARRPLTERMERYARDDTHYLKPLSDKLKLEL